VFTGCCQQPVNTSHNYTICCLYRVDPPDDEQQACSKHVEAYYWNKLIENSASCWFVLYGYITTHCQQHVKSEHICRQIFITTKSVYIWQCKMQIRLSEVSTNAVMASSVRNELSVDCVTYEYFNQSRNLFSTKCWRISSASIGIFCLAVCRD